MRKSSFAILVALVFAVLTTACGSADLGITTKVKSILDSDRYVPSAAQIQVTTENKVVTLAGTVDSPATKRRAVVVAREVEGVVDVVDNLTVVPGSVAEAQPAIAPVPVAETQPALAPISVANAKAQPPVAPVAVVKAEPAVARIPAAKAQPMVVPIPVAEAQPVVAPIPVAETQPAVAPVPVAETQPAVAPIPVAEVQPAAEVAPGTGTAPTDAAITRAVKEKLLLQPETSSENIAVDTHEGVVTLSGSVKSLQAKEQVIQLARGTQGVQRVEDRLLVSSS